MKKYLLSPDQKQRNEEIYESEFGTSPCVNLPNLQRFIYRKPAFVMSKETEPAMIMNLLIYCLFFK